MIGCGSETSRPGQFLSFLEQIFFKFFAYIIVDCVRKPEAGDEVIKNDLLGISFVFGSVDVSVFHKVICSN